MATVRWKETRPLGDVTSVWYGASISNDGSKMLVHTATASGRLFYSTDYGVSWFQKYPHGDTNTRNYARSDMSSDGTRMIVSINSGRIWYSANSASNWTEVRPDGDRNYVLPFVAVSDDGTKQLVAEYGKRVWYSTNSGSSWSELTPAGSADKVWGLARLSDDGTKILVGITGERLYYSTNSGSSWSEVQPKGNANGDWNACSMSRDGTKILVGENPGRLYYSSNSGANWSEMQPAGNQNRAWYGTGISADGTRLMAAYAVGRLYRSFDSGTTWDEMPIQGNSDFYWEACNTISGDGSKWVVGSDGGRLFLGDYFASGQFYVNTNSYPGGTGATNNTAGTNRAFASLYEAESVVRGIWTDHLTVVCNGTAEDTAAVTIDDANYTFAASRFLFILSPNFVYTTTPPYWTVVGTPIGVWNEQTYRMHVPGVSCISFTTSSGTPSVRTYIKNIQFTADTGSTTNGVINIHGSKSCYMQSNIVKVSSGGCGFSVNMNMSYENEVDFRDNIIYSTTGGYVGIDHINTSYTFNYNNLITNFSTGINKGNVTLGHWVKNNVVFNNSDDFAGSYTTLDYNASDDGDGTHAITGVDWGATFANPAYLVRGDFRIVGNSSLSQKGIGPSLDTTVAPFDIRGFSRSGTTCNCGPNEHVDPRMRISAPRSMNLATGGIDHRYSRPVSMLLATGGFNGDPGTTTVASST
jgi:photosystem II stability/assembly factor-like uncharacterized protein